jgi:hypothetical protein
MINEIALILSIISTSIIIIGIAIGVIKKVKKMLATNLASSVEINRLDKESDIYKTIEYIRKDTAERINHISEQIEKYHISGQKEKDQLSEQIERNHKDLLRLQITQALDHRPKDKETIYSLYQEYKEANGNSYIDKLFKNWENAEF